MKKLLLLCFLFSFAAIAGEPWFDDRADIWWGIRGYGTESLEITTNATHLIFRTVPDAGYTNIISLADIVSAASPELYQPTNGYLTDLSDGTMTNVTALSLTINGAAPAGVTAAIRGAALQSADIFQVQNSTADRLFGVSAAGALTATSFAGQVGWSNLVDTAAAISTNMLNSTAYSLLMSGVADGSVTTNKIDATFHGLLVAAPAWGDLTSVPAGFADGVDDTGTSTVTGSASVSLVSGLASMTGEAGAVAVVANGFTVGDGGGALWEWVSSGTTNVGLIYGGTSGHYWKLRPINNRVACTTLGMVGNGSTDNAAKVLLATAFCQANKYVLTIPTGTYNFASKVTFPAITNSFIEGVGAQDSILNWTSTSASEGMYSADAGGNIDWKDFTITGTGTNWALYLAAQYSNVKMERVTMSSPGGGWYQRGTLVNAHIIDCTIKDATNINKSAWYLIGDSTLGSGNVSSNINLIRPRMSNIAASGISLLNVKGAVIDHLVSYNVGNLSPSTHQPHHIYLASGCEDVTIISPDIYGQQDSTDYGSGIQIYSGITTETRDGGTTLNRIPTIKRTKILGGRIANCYDGLIIYGGIDTLVSGLTITNQLAATSSVAVSDDIDGLTIEGCHFYGGTATRGVRIFTTTSSAPGSLYNVKNVSILNNRFKGYAGGAIQYGGLNCLVSGNVILQDVSGSSSGLYAISPIGVTSKNYYSNVIGNQVYSTETSGNSVGGISASTLGYQAIRGNSIWGTRGTGIVGTSATTYIQGNSSPSYSISGSQNGNNL